jgi:hypothetical protein
MTLSRRTKLILLSLPVLLIALIVLYVWTTLHWAYSEGERAGVLQKLSKRGWICKTWEGELLLTSMPGAIPEKFEFSVRDDALAQQLQDAVSKRVVLTYAQRKSVPSSCFGDTEYFIEKVRLATP